jgi:RNA polymerase sigma-70 factor (ECF subfamily)
MNDELKEPQMNEEMTIILAKEGQPEAFRRIYEQHWQRIYSIAFRYTRSRPDAEDILQETFIKAFKRISSFQFHISPNFSSWLNTICLNSAIDILRRRSRRQQDRQVSLTDLPSELHSDNPSPDQTTETKQAAGRIRKALEILTPKQRLIFDLRHNQHMDIKDIASCLRCSQSNVKTQLFRSMKKLRNTLEPVWGKP